MEKGESMKLIKTLIYSLYALIMPDAFDGYGRER